jgi:hypothetical protein
LFLYVSQFLPSLPGRDMKSDLLCFFLPTHHQECIAKNIHEKSIKEGRPSNVANLAVELLQYREDVNWRYLEEFVLHHRALRGMMLLEEAVKGGTEEVEDVPFSLLEANARLSADLLDLRVSLRSSPGVGQFTKLRHKFPDKFEDDPFQVELGRCYLNGPTATFGDVFEVYEMRGGEGGGGGEGAYGTRSGGGGGGGGGAEKRKSVVVYECRHTSPDTKNPAKSVTIDEVQTAWNKAHQALADSIGASENVKQLQLSVGAVGVFSNRRGGKDLVSANFPPKTFVVVAENAVAYFGKSLSARFVGRVEDLSSTD